MCRGVLSRFGKNPQPQTFLKGNMPGQMSEYDFLCAWKVVQGIDVREKKKVRVESSHRFKKKQWVDRKKTTQPGHQVFQFPPRLNRKKKGGETRIAW